MLFNSFEFAVFFPIVTVGYFALPHRARWVWLLVASCCFYAAFVPAFLVILGLSVAIDYAAGIAIEDAPPAWPKTALVVSLVANLGLLAVFKYGYFIWSNTAQLGYLFGAELPPLPRLLLPIGLSFHTFQAMSYTIEVYRGNQHAERHLGIYALYVLFYPQLVAGPIERPQNLLHQFRQVHTIDYERMREGVLRMLIGLVKKVVIADRLALVADGLFDGSAEMQVGLAPLVGIVCFAMQIYCDFSGYSDIALGSANVMGFDLMENFRCPYLSRSLPEFWSRWHISLSTWFKDYVYIPLGGNRAGARRQCVNLMVVFLLSGLWHGASWVFVGWGALHGVLMVAATGLRGRLRIPVFLQVVGTFALVCIGWVLFRADSWSQAQAVLGAAATGLWSLTDPVHGVGGQFGLGDMPIPLLNVVLLIGLVVATDLWQVRGSDLRTTWRNCPWPVRWTAYYAAILLLLSYGRFDATQFIYFQF